MSIVSHIDARVSEFIPQSRSAEELHPKLFASLFPNFNLVKFALIEVLELDRTISMAKTWVYFEKSQQESEKLVTEYFSKIGQLFSKRSFSLSSADEFYFGDRVMFSRVDNPAAQVIDCNNLQWMDPIQTPLLRDHHTRNPVAAENVLDAYKEYVVELSETLLKPYPISYVLLVPVALNHHNLGTHQRKIGAAFLHFGLNTPITSNQFTERRSSDLCAEKRFAQDTFQRINLYWHHWLTSESLHKQVEFARSAKDEAVAAAIYLQEFKEEQDNNTNKVLPMIVRLEKIAEEIRAHVAQQPFMKARQSFLSLQTIFLTCFPASQCAPSPHDPFGHPDLSALTERKDSINAWADTFLEALPRTEAFEGADAAVNLLLEPLYLLRTNLTGVDLTNNPNAPHTALCLAKCISKERIPLAWFLVTLGCSTVQDEHWRSYLQLAKQKNTDYLTALDVICDIRILAFKLGLDFQSMEKSNDSVTINLKPKWEKSFEIFCTSMVRELHPDASPSGGTAKQLVKLLTIGYEVELNNGCSKIFNRFVGSPAQCKILVSDNLVQFQLFTYFERTENTLAVNVSVKI